MDGLFHHGWRILTLLTISAENSGIRKIMLIPKKLTIRGRYSAFIPLQVPLNFKCYSKREVAVFSRNIVWNVFIFKYAYNKCKTQEYEKLC
jgi:hypothetical protein